MSSGGGQSGYSNQNSNSTSTATAPPAIEGVLKNIAGQNWNYFLQHPQAPAYYPGNTVAPQSDATQAYLQGLQSTSASNMNALAPVLTNLSDTASGKFLDVANNPYLQGAIRYSQQPVIDAFNKQILPGITSTFEGAGRTPQAGNLAGDVVGQASDALFRNLAGAATTAGANAYSQERGNQLTAAGLFPSVQGATFQNVGALGTAGQATDAYQQALINDLIARYNYGQNAQQDYLTKEAQQLQAIYPGGSTSGNVSSYGSYMQPGASVSPIGPILGGLGLAASLFGGPGGAGALRGIF